MFPLQQSNELCFRISSSPHHQHKIPQDLILSCALTDGMSDMIAVDNNLGKSRRRKVCGMASTKTTERHDLHHPQEFGTDNHESNNKKKMHHRDIERQRRQEMATLYASLRSLLPLDFIKGKRAISDHMNEAVNYIKHLQKNIKELSVKRNRLKQFDSSTAGSINSNSDSSSSMIVNQSLVGVEIMFSSGFWAKSLRLSRVLHVILEEGLCVRSCTSARADDKFLHTIQAEVDDPARFNLSGLRQRLTQLK